MSVRKVEIRFCDKCSKELVGRLTYRICPCCGKEICLSCIDKANSKHKPRKKVEQVSPPVEEGTEPPPTIPETATGASDAIERALPPTGEPLGFGTSKKKRGRPKKESKKPDISTFSIKTPEPGSDEPYIFSCEGFVTHAQSLIEGVTHLLRDMGIDQKYIDDSPESQGKRELLAILKGDGR